MTKSIEKQNIFQNTKLNTYIKTKISSIKDHISHMQESGIYIN